MARKLVKDLEENIAVLTDELGLDISFDLILRRITIGGKDAALIFVDGLIKDHVTVDIMRSLMALTREDVLPDPREDSATGPALLRGEYTPMIWMM